MSASATMLFKDNDGPPAEIVATAAAASAAASASPTSANNNNNNNNNNDEQRKTHIEVCIRIRPMLQGSVRESSNGFLLNNNANASSSSSGNNSNTNTSTPGTTTTATATTTTATSSLLRRSNISRLPGLFRPTTSSSANNSTPRKQQDKEEQQQNQNQNQTAPAAPPQYAWKVQDDESPTTVRQTTDLIPGRTHAYTLDHIYGPQCSTDDLYQHSVQDLVHASMDGYHTSVLAYGQTSTGKTHTITGTAQQPGILPRAVRECFQYLQNQNSCCIIGREFLLRVSYLEVYKENIRDLLAIGAPITPIRLFEAPDQGLIIKGLREQVVTNADQVFALLRQGEARRQVGATHMNQHSSRSHTIVRIWIESRASSSSSSSNSGTGGNNGGGRDSPSMTTGTAPTAASSSSASSLTSATAATGAVGAVRISSLSIVDLAGSESVRLSKDASRQKEGHYINQSLMALGKVVYALSEAATATEKNINNTTMSKLFNNKQQHIPYRDSKLTRLLQPSLSGNAQVVLICCISPLQDHVEESHNTFKFAIRAKKIPQRATIDEVDGDGDGDRASATLLQSYRQEIEDLKQQLKEAREQQNSLLQLQQQHQSLSSTPRAAIMEETDDEVHELVHAIEAMERLILKSKPSVGSTATTTRSTPVRSSSSSSRPEDLLDDDDDTDFDQHEGELMALANAAAVNTNATKQSTTTTGLVTPVRRSGIPTSSSRSTSTTPMQNNNNNDDNSNSTFGASSSHSTEHDVQLSRELGRIQSLLGSVLKKRKQQANQQQHLVNDNNNSSPQQQDETEVLHLRAKLEQQEISTSLRKADSSFLQQQLQEKDDLLQEVSNILEQLEARQVQLEQENANLKQQLAEARRQAQLEHENAQLRQQLASAVAAAVAAENKQQEPAADHYEI